MIFKNHVKYTLTSVPPLAKTQFLGKTAQKYFDQKNPKF